MRLSVHHRGSLASQWLNVKHDCADTKGTWASGKAAPFIKIARRAAWFGGSDGKQCIPWKETFAFALEVLGISRGSVFAKSGRPYSHCSGDEI